MLQKKYKKLILKIKYLRLEVEDCGEYLQTLSNDFDEQFTKYCKVQLGDDYFQNETSDNLGMSPIAKAARKRNPQKTPEQYTQKQDKTTEEIAERELKSAKRKKIPQVFRKIYKQIAAHTHPDRCIFLNIQSDEYKFRNKMYIKATAALEDGDYEILLDILAELELDLPEVNDDIIIALQKKVQILSIGVNKIYNNPVWIWGHTTLENKKSIFEQVFRQRYKK
tara:strand:+ start:2684 stop:3352 length:669 start_codon:yes stop_codon:yes gene_type:complete